MKLRTLLPSVSLWPTPFMRGGQRWHRVTSGRRRGNIRRTGGCAWKPRLLSPPHTRKGREPGTHTVSQGSHSTTVAFSIITLTERYVMILNKSLQPILIVYYSVFN